MMSVMPRRTRRDLRQAVGAIIARTLVSSSLRAQGTLPVDDPRYAEVRAVVTRVFDGMRSADSALVRSLFRPRGVDAFHLARVGEAWPIVALAETRRRDGCTLVALD
jgi:hypothetical protein